MASCQLILLLIFSLSLISYTQQEIIQMVPALYIFGDSTVDGGNNEPSKDSGSGCDLNGSTIPKRWTNGLTTADYIATFLGLAIVPPFKNSSQAEKSKTGVNYAYGGSGILEKDCWTANCWTFDIQIANFYSTLANNMSKLFSEPALADHLQKSIFFVSFGINDYTLNYVPPYKTKYGKLDPDFFAQFLLNELSSRLEELYKLGARKFLVNSIWPLGCMPNYINQSHPLANCCNETINEMVSPYSNKLPRMLKDLQSELSSAIFSYSDDFQFVEDLKKNADKYGITNTTGWCKTNDTLYDCSKFLYFDKIHTTQAANHWFSLNCFNGTLCSPLNIMQLAGAIVH